MRNLPLRSLVVTVSCGFIMGCAADVAPRGLSKEKEAQRDSLVRELSSTELSEVSEELLKKAVRFVKNEGPPTDPAVQVLFAQASVELGKRETANNEATFRRAAKACRQPLSEGRLKHFQNTWGEDVSYRVGCGEIWVGMLRDQLVAAKGFPYDVNRTTTANLVHEQWVYRNDVYVYLENDIVTAIQN